MPKIVLNQFTGLGDGDKNLPTGQFYSGQDIDLYRDAGYLKPGFLKTDITLTGQDQDIIDIVPGMSTSGSIYTYIFTDSGKVFAVLNANDALLNLGGGTTKYINMNVSPMEGKGIVAYSATDSKWNVYFFYYVEIAKGDANSEDWSAGDFDIDWGSTVPTGKGGLTQGRRDVIEFNSYIWFTNGHYVGKLDVSVNPAVLSLSAFNLGSNWAANRLFKTGNYIGIFASEGSNLAGDINPSASRTVNKSKLILWDGTSSAAYKIIDLPGIVQVHSCINKNGNIFAFVDGGTSGHYWAQLISSGSDYYLEKIRPLKHDISGTQTNLLSPTSNSAIDTYQGNVLFGTYNKGLIMSVGRNNPSEPFQLSCPFSTGIETNSRVTAIKQIKTDKIYAGYYDGTNYKFAKFTTGSSTTASWKAGYTDMGQRIRVNYVKFYFKPLVASDSVTPTLDIDYGTSVTLSDPRGNATISSTLDGAVTSKRFNVKRDCHAFRPAISWTAGGVSFSKIVIDYDFISDN